MSVDKSKLMKDIAVDFEAAGMEVEEKLKAIGPLLALCDRNLSEVEFRLWMDIYNIPVVDPVVERLVKDYVNLLHYSGVININLRMEDSWIDPSNEFALKGVTDEEMAELVNDINDDVRGFEAYFG